jgi:hypothetical protein
MNRHIAFCILIVGIAAGCTTHPPTRVIATPWAAAAVHSFRPYQASDPAPREIDTQVAQSLDDFDSIAPKNDVRLAVR